MSAHEPRRTQGFTLLELILVMGIIGVVAGVGLGMFASFDPGRRAAVGLVQNVLRQAQQSAVARRAPAVVRFDTKARTMTAEALEVAGTWHFESPDLAGARGVDGEPFDFPGEVLTRDGYTGKALDLARGGRRARVEIAVAADPMLDPRKGFALEVALRPAALAASKVIDLGKVVTLAIRADGGLDAKLVTRRVDELGRAVAGPAVTVRSGPGAMRPGRWTRVALVYDRREFVLSADGVVLGVRGEDRELWDLGGPLVLGGEDGPWRGALDQLVLSTVVADEAYELPPTVAFDPRTPPMVRFLSGGALDPALHAGPVEFGLTFDDGGGATILVNLFGTIE